eukprot:TRINITY_DN9929_c0_g1_i1.p1 TRINITY_DN9929_c0_g1~~TRINITY_DN9929_c0_g1_i1.p1  ORF type:complete len:837 (+),score=252.30 TRINITY_DN9929_c0_g1_i1:81-2513(+)
MLSKYRDRRRAGLLAAAGLLGFGLTAALVQLSAGPRAGGELSSAPKGGAARRSADVGGSGGSGPPLQPEPPAEGEGAEEGGLEILAPPAGEAPGGGGGPPMGAVVPASGSAAAALIWAGAVAAAALPLLLLQFGGDLPEAPLPPHVSVAVAHNLDESTLPAVLAAWEEQLAAEGRPAPRFVLTAAGAAPDAAPQGGSAAWHGADAEELRRFASAAAARLSRDPGVRACGCVLTAPAGATLAAGLLPGAAADGDTVLYPALEGVRPADGRLGAEAAVLAAHPGCAVLRWRDAVVAPFPHAAAAAAGSPHGAFLASTVAVQLPPPAGGRQHSRVLTLGAALAVRAAPGSPFAMPGEAWGAAPEAAQPVPSRVDAAVAAACGPLALRLPVHSDRARRAAAALGSGSPPLLGTTVMWDPYCGCTGVNIEAAAFLGALERLVAVRAVAAEDCWCQGYPAHLRRALARMTAPKGDDELLRLSVPDQDRVTVWVSHKPPDAYPTFPYNGVIRWGERPDRVVGRSMIEVDRIPQNWVAKINSGRYVDEVWVPSNFQRTVFVGSGVREDIVHVVPEGLDTDLYDPATAAVHPALPRGEGGEFRFLSNFKWEDRKGWDALLRVYFSSFTPEDGVSLVLKTYLYMDPDPFNGDRIMEKVRNFARKEGFNTTRLPKVQIVSEEVPARDMPGVYAGCDCFVLPTRGEGWGLPMHEAMAMGLPTIATNWGGNTHFMTNDTSLLVATNGTAPAAGGGAFHGARWAQVDEADLRAKMLWVYHNKEDAKRLGARARAHIVGGFTQEHAAAAALRRVAAIRREVLAER